MRKSGAAVRQQWADELQDWLRGAAGGFLFGIPLLYTMEVWWIGSYTEPPLMLIILAVTFVIVFLLNRTDGFRQSQPDQPLKALRDSVEALAIGTLCTSLILVILQEITPQTPLKEIVGKVVLEGLPFAIGVALARSILSGDRQAEPEDNATNATAGSSPSLPPRYNATLADIGATLVGTIFVASNIAPTDEVEMLTAAIAAPWLLAILVTSLVLSYCIVFVAGFTTQERRLQQQGAFQHPLVETVMTYLLSLTAATMMLWFFHQLGPTDPWPLWLEKTLILGLPATIGGAAGRLAV